MERAISQGEGGGGVMEVRRSKSNGRQDKKATKRESNGQTGCHKRRVTVPRAST